MRRIQNYSKYKESGLDWIKQVPYDWKISRLKYVSDIVMGQSPSSDEVSDIEVGAPFLQGNAEFGQYYPLPKLYCKSTNKVSEVDDILFSVRAPVGAMNISNQVYAIGRGLCAIRPKEKNRYLWYLIQYAKVEMNSKLKGSTFESVTTEDVKNLVTLVPSEAEQKNIANFLNEKTSEIDSLIADKEKLIELLEEKRQAIITEAVTKGLNPNVKMKDSGVEWIGEIPEHWKIKKIKHLSTYVGSGKTPKGGGEIYTNEGVMFLRSMNVHFEGLRLNDIVYINPEIDDDMKSTRVKSQDILLNITGASIGRTCIVPANFPPANVNQHVCIIRPGKSKIVPALLSKIMGSQIVQEQIIMAQNGSSREGLNFPQVRNLLLPLSDSIEEQRYISKYIEKQTKELYSSIMDIKEQIGKLKEYRQSLIYEAVTGKIDVREYKKVLS
ncbi:restriction endonuclease subunit S [Bacillus sp. CGMCC 1.16541]|uniref:restriction endonuclease subunit S n=1 Tax=Bacillus sp. CGMCC 1.16541 TaxID=2185143 RepID=UPI000D725E8A|nr:restriction endonuclease subunit S [Bacillus sp. CGMCC 1.16541]